MKKLPALQIPANVAQAKQAKIEVYGFVAWIGSYVFAGEKRNFFIYFATKKKP